MKVALRVRELCQCTVAGTVLTSPYYGYISSVGLTNIVHLGASNLLEQKSGTKNALYWMLVIRIEP